MLIHRFTHLKPYALQSMGHKTSSTRTHPTLLMLVLQGAHRRLCTLLLLLLMLMLMLSVGGASCQGPVYVHNDTFSLNMRL